MVNRMKVQIKNEEFLVSRGQLAKRHSKEDGSRAIFEFTN